MLLPLRLKIKLLITKSLTSMKKITFLLLSLSSIALIAQEHKTTKSDWELGGTSRLNFSQVSLSNWSAGGQNSNILVLLTFPYLSELHAVCLQH